MFTMLAPPSFFTAAPSHFFFLRCAPTRAGTRSSHSHGRARAPRPSSARPARGCTRSISAAWPAPEGKPALAPRRDCRDSERSTSYARTSPQLQGIVIMPWSSRCPKLYSTACRVASCREEDLGNGSAHCRSQWPPARLCTSPSWQRPSTGTRKFLRHTMETHAQGRRPH